jgi:hypothetical protein
MLCVKTLEPNISSLGPFKDLRISVKVYNYVPKSPWKRVFCFREGMESKCSVCDLPMIKERVHYGAVTCYSCRAFFR